MSRLFRIVLAVGFVVTAMQASHAAPGSAAKAAAKPANPLCPIMGGKVSPNGGKVVWNKTTIGFCCKGCIGKFNKLSEKEKSVKLHKAMAKVAPINAFCPIMKKGKVKSKGGSTVWNGKKIGFCCPGCLKKWNKKSSREKDAFVARHVKSSKS